MTVRQRPTASAVVDCFSALEIVTHVRPLSDGRSLVVSGCELTMDRVHLAGGTQGVEIRDGARYRITNSIISGQGGSFGPDRPVLRFSDDSAGTFAFNTVAGNHGFVDCGATSRRLERSIFINLDVLDDPYWGIDPGARPTSQFSGSCIFEQTVVGSRDSTTSPGAIHLDPDFVDPAAGNYHLARSHANRDCCIDRVVGLPDLPTDFDGDGRPMGDGFDIGADEVEQVVALTELHRPGWPGEGEK